MQLKIDREFESKIPPLTAEEFRQLEENIVTDGVVINPIITWNGIIVDGHNRFHILERHPEIKYTTHEKQFDDRFAVIAWICRNPSFAGGKHRPGLLGSYVSVTDLFSGDHWDGRGYFSACCRFPWGMDRLAVD